MSVATLAVRAQLQGQHARPRLHRQPRAGLPAVEQPAPEAAQTVAAHLGLAAVRVVHPHS